MSVIESRIDPRSAGFCRECEGFRGEADPIAHAHAYRARRRPARTSRASSRAGESIWCVSASTGSSIPQRRFSKFSPLAAFGQYDDAVPGAGIVTGIGIIAGRPLVIIANDATVKGRQLLHETVKKHLRAQTIAEENGLGCLYLVDWRRRLSARAGQGLSRSRSFRHDVPAPVPHVRSRIAAESPFVFGGCTAGGAYIPALADHVVMVEGAARIHSRRPVHRQGGHRRDG